MSSSLLSVSETVAKIKSGRTLALAGDEKLLRELPNGNWIGGTIPYFMTTEGGTINRERIFVHEFPQEINRVEFATYDSTGISEMPKHYPKNGLTFLIVPAATEVLQIYAQQCTTWPHFFDRPVVGWVSGVHLEDLGKISPKVFNGKTGESFDKRAVALHLSLPEGTFANIDKISLFTQGDGDTLTFPETTFTITDCFVNGQRMKFADYLKQKSINVQLPLVADYVGAMINVAFQTIDQSSGIVSTYAPVFPMVEYKIAKPIDNYEIQFRTELDKIRGKSIFFACNCVLNFLYANLEGKKTDSFTGPITFGEIAYMLLSQTAVYVTLEKSK